MSYDNLTEVDLVDRYSRAIADQIDDAGIRHEFMDVRRQPGVPENQRYLKLIPGSNIFVLHCRLGWSDRPYSRRPTVNKSATFIGNGAASELACQVAEAMGHWGSLYVAHDHRNCNPVVDGDDKLLTVEGTSGIRLEPFVLNGPQVASYAAKLEELGRDIGRVIADYILASHSTQQAKALDMAQATVVPRTWW